MKFARKNNTTNRQQTLTHTQRTTTHQHKYDLTKFAALRPTHQIQFLVLVLVFAGWLGGLGGVVHLQRDLLSVVFGRHVNWNTRFGEFICAADGLFVHFLVPPLVWICVAVCFVRLCAFIYEVSSSLGLRFDLRLCAVLDGVDLWWCNEYFCGCGCW